MEHSEGTYRTADGVQLFEQSWRERPRAALVLVHGYAEHSGRYQYVAERLVARGYAVHALDLRGHGLSEGHRALLRNIDDATGDVAAFINRVREREPGLPLFLLGHSMGGGIVAHLCIKDPPAVDGVVLSGAVLRSARGPQRVGQEFFSLLGRLFPRLPTGTLGSEVISRDPDIVYRYDNDPLVFRGRMPAGTLSAVIRAAKYIDGNMEEFRLPVLIVHGGADALVEPIGSQDLYERAGSADKTLKVYDGLFHEVLNEPERDRVIDEVARWLDARRIDAGRR